MRMISALQLEPCAPAAAFSAERTDWTETRFTFAGVTVQLRSNVPGLAASMEERYEDHVSNVDGFFEYTVTQTRKGYVFSCDHDSSWLWSGELPVDAVAFLTDAALMAAVIHFDPALSSMHAAGIALGGAAAAISGDSTAGKTTTLLACARAGFKVYSDERVLLRDGVVHPFLRQCTVREGGRARLLAAPFQDELASQLVRGGPLSLRTVFGTEALAGPIPLRALFVLDGYAERARVEPATFAHALASVGRWFDTRGMHLERLARASTLVKSLKCFRVTLGSPHESAAELRRAMESL